jgi:hypothetical protein
MAEHGVKLQIRADAGNVLNHNNAIGPGAIANITSTTVGGGQLNSTAVSLSKNGHLNKRSFMYANVARVRQSR